MAKHRTGKSYKGCCIMCGYHTVRGIGYPERLRARDMRKLGGRRTKRTRRNDVREDA